MRMPIKPANLQFKWSVVIFAWRCVQHTLRRPSTKEKPSLIFAPVQRMVRQTAAAEKKAAKRSASDSGTAKNANKRAKKADD